MFLTAKISVITCNKNVKSNKIMQYLLPYIFIIPENYEPLFYSRLDMQTK